VIFSILVFINGRRLVAKSFMVLLRLSPSFLACLARSVLFFFVNLTLRGQFIFPEMAPGGAVPVLSVPLTRRSSHANIPFPVDVSYRPFADAFPSPFFWSARHCASPWFSGCLAFTTSRSPHGERAMVCHTLIHFPSYSCLSLRVLV